MSKAELPHLGDDQPKENPWQHDRLGYAPFCRRVAETLIRLRAPGGYVIGLNGRWGSGKSTALNFIKSYIEKHNQECQSDADKLTVIDFRPWMVSGHQDVIASFFKVLAESLGDPDPWYKRWFRKFCSIFKSTADPLIDAVAKVGLVIDPSGGTATNAISRGLKGMVSASISRFLAAPSLQKTYENLRSQLAKDGRKFVVTIDDLDRLQDDEVVALLQMVKTVGRLPNIVYILIYDQQIIGRVVKSGAHKGDGPGFIEKIVQQALALPQPGRLKLLNLLDQEISFLSDAIPENERWTSIIVDGVNEWVKRPRDVVRLANALIFAWPPLENELDPADLLAMEGLRIFEPHIFHWIRENRDFFFSQGKFVLAQPEALAAAVEPLKAIMSAERSKSALSLLSTLFPQRIKAFKGSDGFGWGDSYPDQVARRAISTAQGYDAYFTLQIAIDSISNTDVMSFIAAIDDETAVDRFIRGYLGRKSSSGSELIGDFIEELQMRFKRRERLQASSALLNVLVRNGEAILSLNETRGFIQLSPASRYGFLIDDVLDGWSIEEASEHLVRAFQQPAVAPSALSDIYIDRGRELDVFERGGRTSDGPRITEDAFERLGVIVLDRIVAAAADGTLVNAPVYYDIIRAWAHLADGSAPRAWVEKNMAASAAFLIKLGRGMLSHTIGSRRKSYEMSRQPDPEIIDLTLLHDAAAQHLEDPTLSEDERNLLNELVRGSERYMSMAAPSSLPADEGPAVLDDASK